MVLVGPQALAAWHKDQQCNITDSLAERAFLHTLKSPPILLEPLTGVCCVSFGLLCGTKVLVIHHGLLLKVSGPWKILFTKMRIAGSCCVMCFHFIITMFSHLYL